MTCSISRAERTQKPSDILKNKLLETESGRGEEFKNDLKAYSEALKTEWESAEKEERSSTEVFPSFLEPNDPSYLVLAGGSHEEGSLEFYISLKYPIKNGDRNKIYFIYNGKYDFFLESRESSPVISRLQNPGVAWKHLYGQPGYLKSASIGWYHESNGQVIDNKAAYDKTEHAEDFVSRGWDYLGLDLNFLMTDKQFRYQEKSDLIIGHNAMLRLRYFCDCQAAGMEDKEDEIFWKYVKHQPQISDYDGVRMYYDYIPAKEWKLSLSLRTGYTEPFEHWATKVGVTNRHAGFPITLFYFNGYGSEIARYSEYDSYWGVGVEMW